VGQKYPRFKDFWRTISGPRKNNHAGRPAIFPSVAIYPALFARANQKIRRGGIAADIERFP